MSICYSRYFTPTTTCPYRSLNLFRGGYISSFQRNQTRRICGDMVAAWVSSWSDRFESDFNVCAMPEMELSVVLESWDKKEKNEIKAWNLLLLDLSLCFATVMVQFLQKPDAKPQEVWNRRSTFQFPCYSNCRSRQHTQFSISNRQNWLPAVFVLIFAFSGKLAE